MNAKKEASLYGVRGWLFFFVVTLMVLGPARALIETAAHIVDAERAYPAIVDVAEWGRYKTASWVAMAIYCVAMIWTGWRLMRHFVPSSVRIAIAVIWICPLAMIALDIYIARIFLGSMLDEYFVVDSTVSVIAGAVLYASLWTGYLMLSRRVKNTYYGGGPAASGA